ncbi:MAG: hypothetical protein H6983_23865 [Ectothiorhodospiraceae bacterium]|nr:hypothetical protein [Chromatiales bacterium]MCP5157235.1 hypothetical protein [Ectothiorhodospiraceae bacterium]
MADRLTAREREAMGRDLALDYGTGDGRQGNADLARAVVRRAGRPLHDLALASGVDNAVQAIVSRVNTRRGELEPLGHASYGSRHHELIGEPNTEHNRRLVKLYLLQTLAEEPRIREIRKAAIRYDRALDPSRVDIDLELLIGESEEVVNLVVPFNFEGAG